MSLMFIKGIVVHDRLCQGVGALSPLPDTHINTRLQRPAANQNEYLELKHIEIADWGQQSSNCREGTGSLQRRPAQPCSPPHPPAAEAEMFPPVTTHNWSLTLSLLRLNQGVLLNFGLGSAQT